MIFGLNVIIHVPVWANFRSLDETNETDIRNKYQDWHLFIKSNKKSLTMLLIFVSWGQATQSGGGGGQLGQFSPGPQLERGP